MIREEKEKGLISPINSPIKHSDKTPDTNDVTGDSADIDIENSNEKAVD